jgi:hypothetical protein
LLLGERITQPFPRRHQVFGQDTGFGDGGHEVGVAGPVGQGVEVEVVSDADSGELAHADEELAEIAKLQPGVREMESAEWSQPLLEVEKPLLEVGKQEDPAE